MSIEYQYPEGIGWMLSLNIKQFKMQPGGLPEGPYLLREDMIERLRELDLDDPKFEGKKFIPSERSKKDALRYALQELKGQSIEFNHSDGTLQVNINGSSVYVSIKFNPESEVNYTDSSGVNVCGKPTRNMDFILIKINSREEIQYAISEEFNSTGYTIPVYVQHFLDNIDKRVKFYQDHLIDNDIRHILSGSGGIFRHIGSIALRPGVVAISNRWEPVVHMMNNVFHNSSSGVTFSLYKIANDPVSIQSFQTDTIGSMTEQLQRIQEHARDRLAAQQRVETAREEGNEEAGRHAERELLSANNNLRDNATQYIRQAQELEQGFPGLINNPLESARQVVTNQIILGEDGAILFNEVVNNGQ